VRRLPSSSYLSFPFRVEARGAVQSGRAAHVRDLIAQVLLTVPGERVYRPELGAGVQRLVFEPKAKPLWEITHKRLTASLVEALAGEVDPRTLEVELSDPGPGSGGDGALEVRVAYQLAAIGEREEQVFTVRQGGVLHG